MIVRPPSCTVHRRALIDFVDRGELAPVTAAALAHLDRCRRCAEELETTVQAIIALRRLGEDAARLEPSADAWPRLRARLESWRPPRLAILTPAAGAALSMALAVALVVPARLGGSATVESAPPAPPASSAELEASLAQWRVEAAYIATIGQGTEKPADTPVRSSAGTPRIFPDGIRPERKEVSPAEPSGRPQEAI